jgi:hypothetical protein
MQNLGKLVISVGPPLLWAELMHRTDLTWTLNFGPRGERVPRAIFPCP